MFFFFKQKTAYEMRISDWSSDVCSSDLATRALSRDSATGNIPVLIVSTKNMDTDRAWGLRQGAKDYIVKPPNEDALVARINELVGARSEERRVGNECVSTCRARWSPCH